MEEGEESAVIRLGRWEVRPGELRVLDGEVEHILESKVMDVLLALLERPGDVIKRGDLIDRVWGSDYGGDESLTRAISLLRKALGDTRGSHEHIRTIPRQGYQLVAPVVVGEEKREGQASLSSHAIGPAADGGAGAPGRGASLRRSNWVAAASAAVLAVAALGNFGKDLIDSYQSEPPLVVIMDSAHPARVYDQSVFEAGGTNADTLSDILGDLPLRAQKELISPSWNRFEAIAKFDPDLILIHYSGFKQEDARGPRPKLKLLIEYFLASDTAFLIYSRAGRGWLDARVETVIAELVEQHPDLRDRVQIYPLLEYGEASWLDPAAALAIKLKIKDMLAL